MLALANLYDDLFPNVKWIYILRDIKDCYKSHCRTVGDNNVSFQEYKDISDAHLELWHESRPSSQALNVQYDSFRENTMNEIQNLQNFLDIELTDEQIKYCMEFFRPRE